MAGLWQFLGGLALGILLGVVLGPVVRFWLTWHEWSEASREARLTEEVLARMEAGPWRLLRDRRAADASRPQRQPDAS